MYAIFRRLAVLACAVMLVACTPAAEPLPIDAGEPLHGIYVFSTDWHTGIVLARDALTPGLIPEAADFPRAAYLEFGWGDREYYPSPDPTMGMALAAALMPTPAVMHLAGHQRPPRTNIPEPEVLVLGLSAAALGRLIAAIDASFERPEGGRAESLARGLYRDSWFYAAQGRFHLFNTCNTWTARMLSAAGLAISPSGVNSAEDLMKRLRGLPNVRLLTPETG